MLVLTLFHSMGNTAVLPAFSFAKLSWFFRHDRDAQQNRKKPAIRHDAQPTSNSGDNEIVRFHSVGTG
jgi:hypothetical protein